ncbi:hypothetical protein IFR05_007049 [Cadophora sp. M221]|nr:hypothetical protein IFR05_007049 [Cadophora sp. M221]
MFEHSMFNLLPAACFALLALFRILQLSKRVNITKRSRLYVLKLATIGILTVIATINMSFAASGQDATNHIFLSAAIFNVVVAIELIPLSHFEHIKSVRPSLLIFLFIFISALLDVARLRSAWLRQPNTAWTVCLSASLTVKMLVLAVESIDKRQLLRNPEENQSIEDEVQDADFAAVDQTRKFALLIAILKAFKSEIFAVVVPRLCLVGLSIAQPFVIGQTVTFLADRSASMNIGYGLIGAYSIVFISTAITTALYQHFGCRVTTMLRGGLIAAIYSHLMNLPVQSIGESSAMALIGSDTESFAETFQSTITETWADVIQLVLAIYLLARIIGAICVAPILVAIAFTCLSFQVGRMIAGKQRICFEATQTRINFTTEILGRLRDVKALGLSNMLSQDIADLRDQELKLSKSFRRVNVMKICLVNIPMFLGQFAVFTAYGIYIHIRGTGDLSVSDTVTSLSLINLLLVPLRSLLYAIPDTFSALSSLRRIQEFLVQSLRCEARLFTSHDPTKNAEEPAKQTSQKIGVAACGVELPLVELFPNRSGLRDQLPVPSISLRNVAYSWEIPSDVSVDKQKTKTRRMTFATPHFSSSLTIILGPVGCGKSTLLKAILGETAFLEGDIIIESDQIAYCAQEPWLINDTIRQNIVENSLDVCGASAEWYSVVIQACALDVDLSRTVRGDQAMVGSKGVKLSGGQKQRIALARALYSRKKLVILDDVLGGLDNITRSKVFDRVCSRSGLLRRAGCSTVMAMHCASRHFLTEADHIVILGQDGQVEHQGTFDQLQAANQFDTLGLLGEDALSVHSFSDDDSAEEILPASGADDSRSEPWRTPELDVWSFYFKSMGWPSLTLLCVFLSAEAAFGAFRYVWLTWWSSSNDASSGSHLDYWIGLYASFGILEIAGLFGATYFTWVTLAPLTSKKLHSLILATTFQAPVAFLSNTDTGILVNRFSQDVRLIDLVLPRGFISTGFHLFGSLAQAGVAVAALPYLAPVIPFVLLVLVMIQRFHLRTSSQLRILEIETKAPIYTHFMESLNGVITIRAFGWSESVLKRILELVNANQRPYYLLLSVQRWLVLTLNLVVAALVIILVGLGVALRDRVSPGLMGVALVMMTSLGQMMADLIQAWTLLETSLGAVSRVKTFSQDTPNENNGGGENRDPGNCWPSAGAVEFSNFTARHDNNAALVLRDINLTIEPGQRVGVCGRTGSGKSSLIMSLLQMVQVQSGRITIDGLDLATLDPSQVRSRVSCLNQEPFIFSGSIRKNADPFSEKSNEDIVSALRAVELWDTVLAKFGAGENVQMVTGTTDSDFDSGVLEARLDENTFSHGQRQLFSVARTLLRRSPLLLLDEPTSRLDAETHAKIQAIIREQFNSCTTIMVAHRLDSLLDFDLVVVLEAGAIVESGCPTALLADENSALSRLMQSG